MTAKLYTWPQAYLSTAEQCGGKGWNLARLHHYGFQIPRGGVASSELYSVITEAPTLQPLIKQVTQLPTAALMTPSHELLLQLRDAFVSATLPDPFRQALSAFLAQEKLEESAVSIRSSVNQEDGESASFAGIHDSILNIRGSEEIEAAILKCFASLWSSRAVAYRRKMRINDRDVAAAVVINEMVAAKSAGVAFSCDPVGGRQDVITINANYGLGESVVSGRVDPDQYRLHRFNKTITDKHVGRKQQFCQAKSTSGTQWLNTPSPDTACLNDTQIKQLARLCDRVFHTLGRGETHQDIEWAFDGSQFILLQARPVTAMQKAVYTEISDQPEIWSNGNFRDAVPMVMSRLVAEFCDHHINEILHRNFDGFYSLDPALRFARQFEGRFYCNVSLMQWLWFDSVGFPPEQMNISMGGHQPVIKVDVRYKNGVGRKLRRLWRGLRLFKLLTEYRKKAPAIIKRETDFAEHHRQVNFTAMTDPQLIETLHALDKHLSDYNRSFIMLTSQSGALFMLIQSLEKYVGERAYGLANTLMAGQANITSANQGYRLQALAQILKNDGPALQTVTNQDFQARQWQTRLPENSAFKQAFSTFIQEFGHRTVYEIDLSRPRWREDPTYLFDCVKSHLDHPTPITNGSNYQEESDSAWQEIRRVVPRYLHGRIKKQLAAAVAGVEIKELSKSIYVRLMEPTRRAFIEIGQRLVQRGLITRVEDLFHCAQSELESILLGEWDGQALKKVITERQVMKTAQEHRPAPDVIFDDTPQHLAPPPFSIGTRLRGVGVSRGVAVGTARLIKTPEEGTRLRVGDVLVAPSTDPAWTPLFLNASAIVMETGGFLSHGSIVAREYGIPAVVNIAGVFNALSEGTPLRVNGNEGVVEMAT